MYYANTYSSCVDLLSGETSITTRGIIRARSETEYYPAFLSLSGSSPLNQVWPFKKDCRQNVHLRRAHCPIRAQLRNKGEEQSGHV